MEKVDECIIPGLVEVQIYEYEKGKEYLIWLPEGDGWTKTLGEAREMMYREIKKYLGDEITNLRGQRKEAMNEIKQIKNGLEKITEMRTIQQLNVGGKN